MPTPFQTTRLVEFHDTDMAGIMHFASFFTYMESAEHEFIRSLGLSIFTKIDGQSISFPRVAASCDYRSPARCEDVLEIAVSIARLGTKSISYRFDFTLDGREVAQGEMTCVCCVVSPDAPPRSISIPDDIADLLRTHAA
ncbi:MAG: thioesterase family protein [Planctomycetota bacterium]